MKNDSLRIFIILITTAVLQLVLLSEIYGQSNVSNNKLKGEVNGKGLKLNSVKQSQFELNIGMLFAEINYITKINNKLYRGINAGMGPTLPNIKIGGGADYDIYYFAIYARYQFADRLLSDFGIKSSMFFSDNRAGWFNGAYLFPSVSWNEFRFGTKLRIGWNYYDLNPPEFKVYFIPISFHYSKMW